MKVNWEKNEKNTGVLTVEVPETEVAEAIEKAYIKVRKEINLPGFRKGKIPRNMIEKRFGIEIFYEDAANFLLQDNYPKAIDQAGIDPVDKPEIDVEQMEVEKPFIFKATITVKPEVELGQYTNFGIEKEAKVVTDEDINNELKRLQEQHAVLEAQGEGSSVENGDTAVIDFVGSVDGEEFPGGAGENHPLVIGSGSFIPGFEEQLVGKNLGEEVDVNVTFPTEYHAEHLAGKEALFKVKINEIKKKQLPALDDEFAKDNNFDSLEDLKADVSKKLADKYESETTREHENKVVEQLLENNKVEIPAVMVDDKVEDMLKEMEQSLSQQGLDLETYFKFTGSSLEQAKEQIRPQAENDVKFSLIVEAVANKEEIQSTEEDFEAELNKIAQMYNSEVEKIKPIMEAQRPAIEDGIKRRKAFDLVMANK
ncbi:trigger factor [Alkalicella caledoniensis]|uniref:Trigger factor n=1 Tax=Alkalicella caledoniensis TaxID=2731377 RepID=A0A7G9W4R0_ALKCA|nr:trigger factor [Alkalicella caledoniensis]QNO13672.1 trigger factor [Alkalicella caledoniensis]